MTFVSCVAKQFWLFSHSLHHLAGENFLSLYPVLLSNFVCEFLIFGKIKTDLHVK